MLLTNIKLAWRYITKDRLYSFVNIIGLSAGIGFALLIAAYIRVELGVNAQLQDASNQYIIQSKWKDPDEGIGLTSIGPLAKTLKEQYPTLVKNYYRWDGVTTAVSKGDKSYREGIQIGDSTLLMMYGFHLLSGNPATALREPFSLVLTKSKALKYFGRHDVVGQTLSLENFSGAKRDFIITGVIEDPAKNSVTFITQGNDNQLFTGLNTSFFGRDLEQWNNRYIVSYVQLQKGVPSSSLLQPMKDLLRKNADPTMATDLQPYLVPLKEYYLSADNGLIRKLLYSLSAIAIFIVGMAVINFINLSVSRASGRLKEIGIRKVLGGMRRQLIIQFLVESTLLVLLATLAGLGLYAGARNVFSNMLNENLPSAGVFLLNSWPYLVLLVLAVGAAAGMYPALVLSAMNSVVSLKGKLKSVKDKLVVRRSLVGFQFMMAIIVMAGAMVVSSQVQLFFSSDLGYNKDYMISLPVPRNWTPEGVMRMEAIRGQLVQLPQVENISLSYEVPNGNNAGAFALYKKGSVPSAAIQTQSIYTDEYYADAYRIPLAAGGFYGPKGAVTDSLNVVINEKMSRALGFKESREAIGQQVMNQGGDRVFTITGVTKDFHFGSMQAAIQPMTFYQLKAFNAFRIFSVRLRPGDVAGSIRAIQKKWNTLLPGAPFEYTFMDDTLKNLYRTEIQLKKASYIATIISFIIVLLGILGLVSQNVQKRTKEIGIRKVLGSSVKSIIGLFMKEILWTMLIAGLVACPVAWVLMHQWLQGYAYRIQLTPAPFILAIVILGALTALLVTIQTIKTALANPVESLRSE